MASGFSISLPQGTRGPAVHRSIELEDITSESFKHFINSAGIRPQFGKIKIKSYYQTTLMQSMWNLIGAFNSGVHMAMDNIGKADEGALKGFAQDVQDVITGITQTGAFRTISQKLLAGIDTVDGDAAIYGLPFVLMKALYATEAGSTLEIPFPVVGTNTLMMSDSSYGWGQGDHTYSPFGHSSAIVGAVLKTLAINITPMFAPGKGGGETPKLTLTFDLVNDTLQKFEAHKAFTQGIVSQNMWIQYGLVQGPGALYDIKVGDYMGYFMCTGNIQVTPKGTWRKHGINDIPDIFSVTMTFSSLLPNNFNTWLWGKKGFESRYYGGGGGGFLGKLLENAVNAFKAVGASGAVHIANEANKEAQEAVANENAALKNLQDSKEKLADIENSIQEIQDASMQAESQEEYDALQGELTAAEEAKAEAETEVNSASEAYNQAYNASEEAMKNAANRTSRADAKTGGSYSSSTFGND